MAGQYVLADNMYTSQADDSFISHQYIISAQANSSVEFPRGSWGCGGGPSNTITILNSNRTFGNQQPMCWDVTTLGDELDTAGLPWRFYATNVNGYDGSGLWSAYQNIHHIYYGKDWANVINPQSKIITDVANGSLAAVTWVTPTFANSDHSGFGSNTGPKWVASVVNAIGKSKYWKSTAIFIFWDEWGGWFDHVPPVYEDYDGLGFRVPLLIISPYAKQNTSRTSSTSTEACSGSPRTSWACPRCPRPIREPTRPPPTPSTSRRSRDRSSRSPPLASRSTTARLTCRGASIRINSSLLSSRRTLHVRF